MGSIDTKMQFFNKKVGKMWQVFGEKTVPLPTECA
jgi:hypothetical protein